METESKPGPPEHDPRPLMRTLAKLCGLEGTRCRKIVLVLECGCAPLVYAETYLTKTHVPAQSLEDQLRTGILQAGGVRVYESDAPVVIQISDNGLTLPNQEGP